MMKRVLFVCDGDHFPNGAFQLAVSLNKKEKILLSGLFLPAIDYSGIPSITYVDEGGLMPPPDFYELEEKKMDKSIVKFAHSCMEHAISYRVHKNTGFETIAGLLAETRFSDLALIGSQYFFAAMDDVQPNVELKQLLHETECPVLLVPEKFREPRNIILTYDGGSACMGAIKQFRFLMAGFRELPVTLVYFSSGPENKLPADEAVSEYMDRHFPGAVIKVVDDDKEDFDSWISGFPDPLVVAGAYSRSALSRVFKKSFAVTAIRSHKYPLFVFHG